jgi:hypothetical protein
MTIYASQGCDEYMDRDLAPCLLHEHNNTYAPSGCNALIGVQIYSSRNLSSDAFVNDDGLLAWKDEVLVGGVPRYRALVAFAAIMLWAQALECTLLSARMSAFVFSLGIMISDLSHSLFFIGVLLLAFGSSLSIVNDPPYDTGLDATLSNLIYDVLGLSPKDFSQLSQLRSENRTRNRKPRPETLNPKP